MAFSIPVTIVFVVTLDPDMTFGCDERNSQLLADPLNVAIREIWIEAGGIQRSLLQQHLPSPRSQLHRIGNGHHDQLCVNCVAEIFSLPDQELAR